MFLPKISVVVPVYNAAAYIEQCIGSILNQTMDLIEVIAVNDGSSDGSAALLDAMATNDKRLRVYHQSNKGVSASRNFGMQQATGEWMAFCDADDFMEKDMLQKLYDAATQQQCNWAICNVRVIYEAEERQPATRLKITDGVIDVQANRAGFVHGLMRFYYDNANWNKLFSTAVIRKQQLQFSTRMHLWEDLLFNLQYLQFATKAAIVAAALYNYRILPNSIQSGSFVEKIRQFNLLYEGYLSFAEKFAGEAEQEAFKVEMARITYNQLLYQAEVKVLNEEHFFLKRLRGYRQELLQFNPLIFDYNHAERKGLQGIKKQLLQQHHFALFALIIAAKPWLKKPYRFVRRLLKK